ncbi:Ldh family oxidoreductase [Herbaspirillum sp. alder98]|uniref:Ldh family oxidoreductase n=1 Tax=Herbaspirillum sp. alder98 TaxID=2913096 RepID=UPI001CD8F4FC|nr:Ldh family oxidoreductase [Herbaspirillum sp. alder98]MCA1323171.1 Ldh family oxidoreductase [Herbaspirillum sp. alder98]
MASPERFSADELTRFASTLLQKAGLDAPKADSVASTLVDGDLLGHDTHGLALLAPYVKELEKGSMTKTGAPQVLSERAAALAWDGRRLPGPWLVHQGIDALIPKARDYGTASLTIHHSHHIACLAAYLLRATQEGFVMVLASSDPAVQSVAPFGGTRAVFTPNPIAAGIPTSGTPFLIDISASVTTNGMSNRLHKAGRQFDEEWLIDGHGNPSRDPAVLAQDPPGTILPLGGLAAGHKGFGLAVLIEALTGGLSGYGRADPPSGWGATVFMSLYDPSAFGGTQDFLRQMDFVADACRTNPPRPGVEQVRMPGDRGMQRRAQQLKEGVALHPTIAPALREAGSSYGLDFPTALSA